MNLDELGTSYLYTLTLLNVISVSYVLKAAEICDQQSKKIFLQNSVKQIH